MMLTCLEPLQFYQEIFKNFHFTFLSFTIAFQTSFKIILFKSRFLVIGVTLYNQLHYLSNPVVTFDLKSNL